MVVKRYGKMMHVGNRHVFREIRGEWYDFDSEHVTKEEAQKRAKEIRSRLHKVRVIKGYVADGGYDVWVRYHGTKKSMQNMGLLE